jgi:hypothetical protein
LPNLPTSHLIENGEKVTFSSHLKDVLKFYDIIPAPSSLLEGIQIPQEGSFFMVMPENPEAFWKAQAQKHSSI